MFVLGSCRSAMVPLWPSMAAVVGRTCIRPTSPTVPTAFGLYALSTCATASATSAGRPRCWASWRTSRTCVRRPMGCGLSIPSKGAAFWSGGVCGRHGRQASARSMTKPLLFAPVAIYGGYFGAGMSVMTLAILGLSGPGDHRTTNALKNLLNVLANVVAIGIYIVHGIVAWSETTAMMAGALIGGFVGGRSMRFLPAGLFRALVVGMGAILTVVFAWRYWNL